MKLKKSIKIATIITSLTLMLTGCSNSASDKDIKQDNKDTKEEIETVTVPDIIYKNLKEAEKILKENKLNIKFDEEINNKEKENYIVKEQIPSAGITINLGSCISVNFGK